MLIRAALSLASPSGEKGRLSVLIFHRVLASSDPLFPDVPTAKEFEARMRWVRNWFTVLPLGPAIEMLYAGKIPSRAMAITFDDGYADNEEVAAPVLASLGLTATFFISTGFLDGGCMWNDRVIEAVRACETAELDVSAAGLGKFPLTSHLDRSQAVSAILSGIKHFEPRQRIAATDVVVAAAGSKPAPSPMMRSDQLRRLRNLGMDIGAHTVTHPILTRLDPDAAVDEMASSKRELEGILGETIDLFAYPNGVPEQDYALSHALMARDCGFRAAVSTAWGAASARSNRFQLPRFAPWDRTELRYGARLLHNLTRQEKCAV